MTDETATVSPTDDPLSVISQLREKRKTLGAGAKPLRLEVPGYDGLLLIDFKWVPFSELAKNALSLQKVKSPIEVQIAAACDTLIATCDGFFIRIGEDVKPLDEDEPFDTFGDPRLPELLGYEAANSARESCRSLFANEYSLITTANTVLEWLQDTTRAVDEEHLGN